MTIAPLTLNELDDKFGGVDFVPQAVIDKPISEICRRFGATVAEGHDSLDYFEATGALLDGRFPISLKHYRGYPKDTTTIYLTEAVKSEREIREIINSITRDLKLSESDFVWKRYEMMQKSNNDNNNYEVIRSSFRKNELSNEFTDIKTRPYIELSFASFVGVILSVFYFIFDIPPNTIIWSMGITFGIILVVEVLFGLIRIRHDRASSGRE